MNNNTLDMLKALQAELEEKVLLPAARTAMSYYAKMFNLICYGQTEGEYTQKQLLQNPSEVAAQVRLYANQRLSEKDALYVATWVACYEMAFDNYIGHEYNSLAKHTNQYNALTYIKDCLMQQLQTIPDENRGSQIALKDVIRDIDSAISKWSHIEAVSSLSAVLHESQETKDAKKKVAIETIKELGDKQKAKLYVYLYAKGAVSDREMRQFLRYDNDAIEDFKSYGISKVSPETINRILKEQKISYPNNQWFEDFKKKFDEVQ